MSFYLALKEMLRHKFRFVAIALIVALITLLVLFLVSMAEGLARWSSEYIASIDAELIIFRERVNTVIPASSLGHSKLNDIERLAGVEAVGPIGFSTAAILVNRGGQTEKIDVALIGVEPGRPGAPSTFAGTELTDDRAEEVVIDQNVLDRVNIPVGSTLGLEVLQGAEEQHYPLTVVGHTTSKMYNLPTIFVPLRVWDKIKPREKRGGGGEIIFNVAAVKLQNPDTWSQMADTIEKQVNRVEATDLTTAYESLPGYRDMQSVISMQQSFIMLVAVLVIGGFFQIQALQKVVQVGMLKAIGASNTLIASTMLVQVMLTTIIGMMIGGIAMLTLTASLPSTIPIIFNGPKVITGVITLFLMGPIASFFSIRTLLKVEPLKALGLGV